MHYLTRHLLPVQLAERQDFLDRDLDYINRHPASDAVQASSDQQLERNV
jgi:hypothetical protein